MQRVHLFPVPVRRATLFLGAALAALALAPGCESDTVVPAKPTRGPQTHPDIPYDELVTAKFDSAKGGDPRGVYAPNNPLLVFYPPDDPGVTITEVPIEKYGAGTVTFSGASAARGRYQTEDWFLSVRSTVTFTEDTTTVTFPVDASGVFLARTGTWETPEPGLMILDGRDSIDYNVDEKAMYLYRYIPYWRKHVTFPPLLVPVTKVLKR
ncbi:MAG: hypothetical protein AB1505_30080 [Candidatus Latescibacterota bacterium]